MAQGYWPSATGAWIRDCRGSALLGDKTSTQPRFPSLVPVKRSRLFPGFLVTIPQRFYERLSGPISTVKGVGRSAIAHEGNTP